MLIFGRGQLKPRKIVEFVVILLKSTQTSYT